MSSVYSTKRASRASSCGSSSIIIQTYAYFNFISNSTSRNSWILFNVNFPVACRSSFPLGVLVHSSTVGFVLPGLYPNPLVGTVILDACSYFTLGILHWIWDPIVDLALHLVHETLYHSLISCHHPCSATVHTFHLWKLDFEDLHASACEYKLVIVVTVIRVNVCTNLLFPFCHIKILFISWLWFV